ncbi:hypothetical protein J7K50_04475, partial [bacterium]|nr:hypothetical protein [bacterium]
MNAGNGNALRRYTLAIEPPKAKRDPEPKLRVAFRKLTQQSSVAAAELLLQELRIEVVDDVLEHICAC